MNIDTGVNVQTLNTFDDINIRILIDAIRFGNEIDEILFSNKNPTILTSLDKLGDSPIYMALLVGNTQALEKMIHYAKEKQIVPVELDYESLGSIATVVESPQAPDMTPIKIIDNYLRPLFITESINKLMGLIGDDAIYNYM
jgi:hypothetical protein